MINRPATVGDAEAVAAIYVHHVTHGTASFDTEPRSLADTRGKIAECIERGWPFLVAEDALVLGYASATPFRDRPAYAFTCEDSVYVDANAHGRGVGTALLLALIDESERAGFRQMIAVIGGGEPASVTLHAKQGFVEAGRLRSVGRKFGRWLDTVFMQRAIGDGNAAPPIDRTYE